MNGGNRNAYKTHSEILTKQNGPILFCKYFRMCARAHSSYYYISYRRKRVNVMVEVEEENGS
jgi:hypothetical protein